MTSHKIEPFDPGQETFSRYVQRVKIYFTAHGVADDKQKFVFLSSLSRKHYTLLANLVSPEDPGAKTLDELVDTLTLHFQPKTSEIAERESRKFWEITQYLTPIHRNNHTATISKTPIQKEPYS